MIPAWLDVLGLAICLVLSFWLGYAFRGSSEGLPAEDASRLDVLEAKRHNGKPGI